MCATWFRGSVLAIASGLLAGLGGCGTDLVLPPDPVTLTVGGAGSGSGVVATTVGPAPMLQCSIVEGSADSGACRGVYAVGTAITLSADPADGSRFTGWSGPCTGTAACGISLGDSARVVATFEVAQFTLTIVGAGSGDGTIQSETGSLPVIDCAIDAGRPGDTGCGGTFLLSGNRLVLTASPAAGSRFYGWGGDCSGTSSCAILLDRDRVVSAAFVLRR